MYRSTEGLPERIRRDRRADRTRDRACRALVPAKEP
ncbi:hypothetical protein EDD94_6471 [Streptomyces sp. PanSC9]|nr:hypothetical protein EDD94_6471 [Streptomyces sp. PanSC9]